MKTFYLLLLMPTLFFDLSFGKIRNGYEPQLETSRVSLLSLNFRLLEEKNMSPEKRLRLKSKIADLTNYISFYELTEEFIRQIRMVSPLIFMEIDNIKDGRGRPTDVYIKLIPKEKSRIQLRAASFFEQLPRDDDANHSRYGPYSVAIDVWMVDNALFLLSHEFGHVKYIVPNLASYSKYYQKQYPASNVNTSFIGHSSNDQSGKSANDFEKKFVEERKRYFHNGGRKPESLVTLFIRIRKNTRNQESDYPPTLVSNRRL